VTASGRTLYAAGAANGGPAMGWTSSNGTTWTSTGTLEQTPASAAETTSGACPTATGGAVVVGSVLAGTGGARGAAWPVGRAASAAQPGDVVGVGQTNVLPAPPVDSDERLLGCAAAGGQLVAWGASAASNGTPEAALWTSPTGEVWTRQSPSALGSAAGTAAITDLATDGDTWLAVTGASTSPWTEDTLATLGVWQSPDAGKTWQQVTTAGSPWMSSYGVSADQVAYLDGRAVIVGQVDSRLAVWVGTPTGP
jgi:hypothetical protein